MIQNQNYTCDLVVCNSNHTCDLVVRNNNITGKNLVINVNRNMGGLMVKGKKSNMHCFSDPIKYMDYHLYLLADGLTRSDYILHI